MTKPRKKPKSRKCPVCGHAVTEEFKPFCSKRCADADLVRWLKGAYAIPGARAAEEDLQHAESDTETTPDDNPGAPSKAKN